MNSRILISIIQHMPRGRPPKNKPLEKNDSKKNVKLPVKSDANASNQPVRQKRKYTRRKPVPQNIGEDNTLIKTEAKKRGRKRGRKKKDTDLLFKPEEMLDYIQRNYPQINIDTIRDKIIDGLKTMREFGERPYLLYKFTYNDNAYYYDDHGAILNTDGKLIGYFIPQPDGNNKMYMFHRNKGRKTFQEIIDSIENKSKKSNISSGNQLDVISTIPSDVPSDIQSYVSSDESSD